MNLIIALVFFITLVNLICLYLFKESVDNKNREFERKICDSVDFTYRESRDIRKLLEKRKPRTKRRI